MGHCDYWWFAGHVEWCDLAGGPCRCGGWEESCALKERRKRNQKQMTTMMDEMLYEPRQKVHRHVRRAS